MARVYPNPATCEGLSSVPGATMCLLSMVGDALLSGVYVQYTLGLQEALHVLRVCPLL